MTPGTQRPDDAVRLRQFKAEFFKALGHPLRIRVLELLRGGPLSVTQIEEITGAPASSVSQQLAVLRGRNIVTTRRRGTTIIYEVADAELFELLDVARRIFNAHLADTIDLLRLVEHEAATAADVLTGGPTPGSGPTGPPRSCRSDWRARPRAGSLHDPGTTEDPLGHQEAHRPARLDRARPDPRRGAAVRVRRHEHHVRRPGPVADVLRPSPSSSRPLILLVAGVVAGLITSGWTGLFVVGVGQIAGQVVILVLASLAGRSVPVDLFSGLIATVWFGAPIAIGYGLARGAVWIRGRGRPEGDAAG